MKVLTVCLGNICRSPLAEGVLKQKCTSAGLIWTVDSAGTAAWHKGKSPDPRSIAIAERNNINIQHLQARQFVKEDFERFDLILAMDSSNMQNILALSQNASDQNKVELIMNYLYPKINMAVPDPYYDGRFEEVFEMINLACDKIVEKYKK